MANLQGIVSIYGHFAYRSTLPSAYSANNELRNALGSTLDYGSNNRNNAAHDDYAAAVYFECGRYQR